MELQAQGPKDKKTIAVLDGVRAFACFSVIAYHLNHITTKQDAIWGIQDIGSILYSFAVTGYYGVTLFFVLSGFLLFLPYAQSLLFDTPWPSLRRYYLRRIFRIWPGYFVSLFIIILIAAPGYLHPEYWHDLVLFLTFFMDSSKYTYQVINGPYWTLAVEWQYYMLLPLLAWGLLWLVKRGSLQRRLTFLSLGILALITWGVVTRYWGRSWQLNPSQQMLLPSSLHHIALFFLYGQDGKFMEDFGIGMAVCVIYTVIRQDPQHVISSFCVRWNRWILVSGICLFVFAVLWTNTPLYIPLQPYLQAHNWFSEILYSVPFGLCILSLITGPSYLRLFFELPITRGLGQLSYSLYIWHLPFLLRWDTYILPLIKAQAHWFIYTSYWFEVIFITLPFCFIFYHLIERPGIAAGNIIIKKYLAPAKKVEKSTSQPAVQVDGAATTE